MENFNFASDKTEAFLAAVHDSIQRIGYAEVKEEVAASFDEPGSTGNGRCGSFFWKMFKLGYSVSYNEEERAFILINEPEVGQ